MSLNKNRQGEIAYAVLKEQLRSKGIPTLKANDALREVGNRIQLPDLKAIGVTEEEAIAFLKGIYRETFEDFMESFRRKD